MKKTLALVLLLLMLSLAACGEKPAENVVGNDITPDNAGTETLSPAVPDSSAPDSAGEEIIDDVSNLKELPPVGADAVAAPDFLDEEQRLLYQQAYRLHLAMFGGETTGIDMTFPREEGDNAPDAPEALYQPEGAELAYLASTGALRRWADFEHAVYSVFSADFWAKENAEPIYIGHDGWLYILDASYGDQCYNENFPDTFRLVEQSQERIIFEVTAHYSYPWPRGDESYAQRDERLKTSYEYTVTYPVTLVLLDCGWRVDEFNTANSADFRGIGTWEGISDTDFYAN